MTGERLARERWTRVAILVVLILAGCTEVASDEGERGWREAACAMPHEWAVRVDRGWRPTAATRQDLIAILDPPSSHSGPQDHLQEVPLIFYGPRYLRERGSVELPREVTLADVVPTYARLMRHEFPHVQGKAIGEILNPEADPPRLIVTIVIDGGGWNALHAHEGVWPTIESLAREGASVEHVVVGSSPSVTSATHTTLATGVFPKTHGVTALQVRADDGQIVPAFAREFDHLGPDVTPDRNLKAPTLAETWDVASGNEAEIAMVASFNYALGMIGRGALFDGGDQDILALGEPGIWETDPQNYRLPRYLEAPAAGIEPEKDALDASDGKRDGTWNGYDMSRLDATPAFSRWEARTITTMLEREPLGHDEITDLLYVNFKAPDQAAHQWTLESEQERLAIESVDQGIAQVKETLDRLHGDGYLMLITADHGQTEASSKRVTLIQGKVVRDVQAALAAGQEDSLIEKTASTTYFLDEEALEEAGRTREEVADFLSAYRYSDYTKGGPQLPSRVDVSPNDYVFKAVFPGTALPQVLECTRG